MELTDEYRKMATGIADEWWRTYRGLFRGNALEKQDLKQEAYLAVSMAKLENIEKFADAYSLPASKVRKSFVRCKVNWHLWELYFRALEDRKFYKNFRAWILGTDVIDVNGREIAYTKPNPFWFLFNDLQTICTEREYRLLEKRYKEGKVWLEIGEEMGLSSAYCCKTHKMVLKKLHKWFAKTGKNNFF